MSLVRSDDPPAFGNKHGYSPRKDGDRCECGRAWPCGLAFDSADGMKAALRISHDRLLSALQRLLSFPQNQDSTDIKLFNAISAANVALRKAQIFNEEG